MYRFDRSKRIVPHSVGTHTHIEEGCTCVAVGRHNKTQVLYLESASVDARKCQHRGVCIVGVEPLALLVV